MARLQEYNRVCALHGRHHQHCTSLLPGTGSRQGVTLTGGHQLLKAINKLPGLSETEIDNDAILLRAYGKGTDVLIDRKSECTRANMVPAGSH